MEKVKMNAIQIVESIERERIKKSLAASEGIRVGSYVSVLYLSTLEDKKPKSKKAKAVAERKREKTKFEGIVTDISQKSAIIRVLKVHREPGNRIEKIFPLCSPNIEVNLMRQPGKFPRKAKLFYMRERAGKSARL